MSKKISEMDLMLTASDVDEIPILKAGDPITTQNRRVPRSTYLSGYALQSAVDIVQGNLDTHAAGSVATAHPDGVTQNDLSNHKIATNQHTVEGVTGLRVELDAKANTADLGNSATRDVGTGAGDVAAGDAPANSISAHTTTFDHGNIPITSQKEALNANPALSSLNAVAGADDLPLADQQAAMDAANNPSDTNPFATIADVGSGGTHAGLPDLNTSGHPGSVITIGGGVQGNAVSIAADGSLQDSGTPPGGTGTTNLSNTPSATEVTVESSSGTNTSIVGATGSLAGMLTAADKTKLDGLGAAPVDSVSGQHSVAAAPITGAVVVNLVNDVASPGNSKYYGTSAVGARGFHDLPAGSGWQDGTTVTDWGLTPQNLGTISANTQVDLDNGHEFTGTMDGLGDWEIDFISTAGHAATQWTFTMDVAGRTPVWKYSGVVIDTADGYDISGSPSRIEFFFKRNALGVSVSERKIT